MKKIMTAVKMTAATAETVTAKKDQKAVATARKRSLSIERRGSKS
jgi:hypothetical protein